MKQISEMKGVLENKKKERVCERENLAREALRRAGYTESERFH